MATARTELFLCFGVLIGSASAGLAWTEPGALPADDLRAAHCIKIVDPPAFGLWGGEVPAIGTYALTPPGAGYCGAAGALDVVISNSNAADRVCRGEGDGTFSACEDVGSTPVAAKEVAAGTIDGDSIPDLVFAVGSGANRFCAGDGTGGFSHCTDADPADRDTSSVALGFVDGDLHLDAVFGNTGSFVPDERRNRVCLGNGDGTFMQCTDVSTDTKRTAAVALGHLNGDSHLDAVFANTTVGAGDPENARNRVCLGNGDGTFMPCADVSADEERTGDVALGLVDDDSNLDLVFGESNANAGGENNHVCLGNGDGTFGPCTDIPVNGTSRDSFGVALGFVDGNSDLDAVFANGNMRRNRVCLGNGDGTFTPCTNVSLDDNYSSDVALGLLDEDPHLDALFTNVLDGRNRVCLGNGDGTFTCQDIGDDEADSTGIAVADFGDPDIFADGFESGDTSAWATTVP